MTLVLMRFGTSTPTELLPGTGARMWMRSALSAAAMLLLRLWIFSSFTPGRRMQFIARDRRAFGDVAERHFNVELRERLLHEPGVGHQFLLGLGRLGRHVRVLEKIHRRQLVIADHAAWTRR